MDVEQELLLSITGSRLYTGFERGGKKHTRTNRRSLNDSDATIAKCPCDFTYLLALSRDLITMSHHLHTWYSASKSRAVLTRVFETLMGELVRLDKNPDLMPSAEVGEAFWEMVAIILSQNPSLEETKRNQATNHMPPLFNHLQHERAWQMLEYRGTYDFRKTLWQQFLCHMAPGAGGLPPMLPPNIGGSEIYTKFVIPPAGLEIMRRWESNIEILRMKIDRV